MNDEREKIIKELETLKEQVSTLQDEISNEEQSQEQIPNFDDFSSSDNYNEDYSNNSNNMGQTNVGREKIGQIKTLSRPGIGVGVGQNTYNGNFFGRFGNRAGIVKISIFAVAIVICAVLLVLLFNK